MGTDKKDDFDSSSSLNWSNVRYELPATFVDELAGNGNFEKLETFVSSLQFIGLFHGGNAEKDDDLLAMTSENRWPWLTEDTVV
ncbi:hypothetical protein PMIT1342_01728 [Prochlorococcus marinus str. MIT 1342]|uniref:hypothetical protein n=1 Tax=Prochlorococcus TaxID=1218 RepID=UPI0007B3EA60|nr:hypothetical protein [Prochlorococcus marinus]KZR81392.1 hypothetical protein PMIT1342_01728 [Prochlorococcus marinus str. MIT 1342]